MKIYINLPYRVKEMINMFAFDSIESFDKLVVFNKICDYKPCKYSNEKLQYAYNKLVYSQVRLQYAYNKIKYIGSRDYIPFSFKNFVIFYPSDDGIFYYSMPFVLTGKIYKSSWKHWQNFTKDTQKLICDNLTENIKMVKVECYKKSKLKKRYYISTKNVNSHLRFVHSFVELLD